jgi:DNA-binding MarR family transcriptional regulator
MTATRKLTRSSLLLQQAIAASAGLNPTDAECMDFLQEMGPSTAGDLAKATRLTTGAITAVIDRLERAGFVRRDKDPLDRRKVIVTLVADKHAATGARYGAMAADIFTLYGRYSPQELGFLQRYTEALTEVFIKHTS